MEGRHFFRYKKREQEKREQVEIHSCKNEVRKFYQIAKRLTEGYKPGAFSCKDEKGVFVGGC